MKCIDRCLENIIGEKKRDRGGRLGREREKERERERERERLIFVT